MLKESGTVSPSSRLSEPEAESRLWAGEKSRRNSWQKNGCINRIWNAYFHGRPPGLPNYPILQDKGKVSAIEAKLKAEQEYDTYRKRQDREFISDFDREIKRIQGKQKSNNK